MPAHLRLLTLAVGLLASSCYLRHSIGDSADASVDGGDAASRELVCCLQVRCGAPPGEACEAGLECDAYGCADACEGPRCGGGCCEAGELCIFDRCVAPGGACADDAVCGAGERCELSRCIPHPQATCFAALPFEPELEWENAEAPSASVPLVVHLTDDDGDGLVGPGDIPDVVTPVFVPLESTSNGTLVALSGDDGRRLWELGDQFVTICSFTTAAAGDLDGDGTVEIAVLGRGGLRHFHRGTQSNPGDPPYAPSVGPYHFHEDGGLPSHLPPRPPREPYRPHLHSENGCTTFDSTGGFLYIVSHEGEVERVLSLPLLERAERVDTLVVVDLDADGEAEVIAGGAVVGNEGVRWYDERIASVGIAVADVDLDGRMEIVTSRHVFEHDGTLKWSDGSLDANAHPAIARVVDRGMSGPPQVIVADAEVVVARDGASGEIVWGPVRYAAGESAGPPTVADFDGDGLSEIGVMADHGYVVFDPGLRPPHVRWTARGEDSTPGTVGATAFDFDADGAADVVFSDECHLRILSGRSGELLWHRSNPSRTVWEYPVVADVDADGRAELLVPSNLRFETQITELGCDMREDTYLPTPGGLRLFRDRLDHWAGTRQTWNQHGYSVDNVGDMGEIPATPPRPWDTHNTYRVNPRYPDPRDRPLADLSVAALTVDGGGCEGPSFAIRARVENHGSRGVESGVGVRFEREGAWLGEVLTDEAILPGGATWVTLVLRRERLAGARVLSARVDAETAVEECDEGNNRIATLRVACE